MSDHASTPLIDSEPPIALDKFIEQSGLSAVTLWRYRRAGWLNTLNICGRHYLTRAEIARFNGRAAAGEFAKLPTQPKRRRKSAPKQGLQSNLNWRAPITSQKSAPDGSENGHPTSTEAPRLT